MNIKDGGPFVASMHFAYEFENRIKHTFYKILPHKDEFTKKLIDNFIDTEIMRILMEVGNRGFEIGSESVKEKLSQEAKRDIELGNEGIRRGHNIEKVAVNQPVTSPTSPWIEGTEFIDGVPIFTQIVDPAKTGIISQLRPADGVAYVLGMGKRYGTNIIGDWRFEEYIGTSRIDVFQKFFISRRDKISTLTKYASARELKPFAIIEDTTELQIVEEIANTEASAYTISRNYTYYVVEDFPFVYNTDIKLSPENLGWTEKLKNEIIWHIEEKQNEPAVNI